MIDFLGDLKRTGYCGDLDKKDVNREVVLLGWVQRRRDLGGLIFVELRDRQGIVQVVFNPEINPQAHEKAQSIRSEYVLGVQGTVVMRPEGTANPKMSTGEIHSHSPSPLGGEGQGEGGHKIIFARSRQADKITSLYG